MKYLVRFLLYLVKSLSVLLAVLLVCSAVFFLSMNTTNNFVLAQDGMKARAQAVLTPSDEINLYSYFSVDFVQNEPIFHGSTYMPYTIRTFNQKVSIKSIWCWPWEDTATAIVQDVITYIDGEMSSEYMTQEQREQKVKIPPPAWQNGVYKLTFRRIEGSWKIDSVELIETVALPTPTPSPAAT
jgi:hypothetical protein